MNNQCELAGKLVDELLEAVHHYDGEMCAATAVGCLELVKQQLVIDSFELEEDD